MRAPLSIVIPTLNSVGPLGPTVSSLAEGIASGLIRELVLSDGGSCDGIEATAKSIGANLAISERGRGRQLAAGATRAQGDWILFIHDDTHLESGWSKIVASHCAGTPDIAAYFRLRFRARGLSPKWVAGWANFRSVQFGLPYGDQGLLISRQLYRQVGGFADIPLMEDVDLAKRLKGRLQMLDCHAETGAERYETDGWIKRGSRNLLMLARFSLGSSPEKLYRDYERN